MSSSGLFAQNVNMDSGIVVKVTIHKDYRIGLLEKVQFDMAKTASRYTSGYRLFVLKSNNREYAMKVRSYLLQNFPEEKVIMTYQAPFIKMKFGDFEDKSEAERIRNLILKGGVVTGNVYIVPDTIELKPERKAKDEQ